MSTKQVLGFLILLLSSVYGLNLLSGGMPTSNGVLVTTVLNTLVTINDGNLCYCAGWYHSTGLDGDGWVSIQMISSQIVNTILYIAGEHYNCCPERNVGLEFRVGMTAGPKSNPVCVPSPIKRTGWYQCTMPMMGLHVSVNRVAGYDNFFQATEMLAYTEFAIQMNAK